jgi:uncharacterized membrane protein
MELLTTILAYLHILSAMMWLGGAILFGFVIAPGLSELKTSSVRDFYVTIAPRMIRFFQVVAGSTVLFGLLLVYIMTKYEGNSLSLTTGWGVDITIGSGLAILALLVSEFMVGPAYGKLVRLHQGSPSDGSNPPPQLARLARTAGAAAIVVLVLLLTTMAFMAAAGFY